MPGLSNLKFDSRSNRQDFLIISLENTGVYAIELGCLSQYSKASKKWLYGKRFGEEGPARLPVRLK